MQREILEALITELQSLYEEMDTVGDSDWWFRGRVERRIDKYKQTRSELNKNKDKMIIEQELTDYRFSIDRDGKLVHATHPGTNFNLNKEGIVDFVRNGDNYHGLSVHINSIYQLVNFLTFL